MKIELGVKARDVVTGFEGTVTARAEYLTGCNQYALTPGVDEKGKVQEGHWFDENRIVVLDEKPVLQRLAEFVTRGGPQRDQPNRTS